MAVRTRPVRLPPLRDGLQALGYFQTLPGLFVAGTLTLLSLPVPPLMLWAILAGNTITPSGPNTWMAAAALLFMPLIFGWLFLKSLRERRRLMVSQAMASPIPGTVSPEAES